MCAVHGWDAPCRCGYALGLAALVLAAGCGPRPDVCSENDAALIVNEASCLAQVKARCAGIPLNEPCPFEEDCKAFTRERCQ
jgi:hypothetical protein